jgi:hypothetical protein
MFKSFAIATFALLLALPAVQANGILTLQSDEQAIIFLDGEEVGTTPVTLRDIEPGYHTVRFENPRTHQVREYQFYSPRKMTVEKQYAVDFSKEPMPAMQTGQVMMAPQGQVLVPVEQPKKDNTKARMRNVALGAGLVNEVFNKGGSKSGVRKGVVGAGLLNELLNK